MLLAREDPRMLFASVATIQHFRGTTTQTETTRQIEKERSFYRPEQRPAPPPLNKETSISSIQRN